MITTSSIFNTFFANWAILRRSCSMRLRSWSRMLMLSRKRCISSQKEASWMHILIMIFDDLLETIDKYCLKLSQKQTILSSKKMLSSTSHRSLIVRLIAIMSCLRCMRVSFQNIKFVFRISSQRFVLFLMSQMLEASKFREILNRACVVWSSFSKVTTILDDATTRTMRFSKRNFVMTMFWTKILSICSESSRKKRLSTWNSLFFTIWTMIETTIFWFSLNLTYFSSTVFETSINCIFSRINLFFFIAYWLKSMTSFDKLYAKKLCWVFDEDARFNSVANRYSVNYFSWYSKSWESFEEEEESFEYSRWMIRLQSEENLVYDQKSHSKRRKFEKIDESERRKWSIKYRKSISHVDNQSNSQKTKHHHQNLMIECRIEISAKFIFSRFQTRKINTFTFKSTHLKIAFRHANQIKSTYATLWASHSFRDFAKLHSNKIVVNKSLNIDSVSNIVIFFMMSCHSSSLWVKSRWTHVCW